MASPNSAITLAKSTVSSQTSTKEVLSLLSQLSKTIIESSLNRMVDPRVPPRSRMQPFSPSQSFGSLLQPKLPPNQDKPDASTLEAKNKQGLSAANAAYGETPPDTIRDLTTTLLDRHNGGNKESFNGDFVDIGSGNGIATTAAAMTGRWKTCRGIEYDTDRHETALSWKLDYDSANNKDNAGMAAPDLQFACGDMLQYPHFPSASVVFANCPTWDASLIGAIGTVLEDQLSSNAIVVP